MTTNAAELGTNAPQLATLARRLGLPLPRAGHWMKKEVGKEPPTPEFPVDPALDPQAHAIPRPPTRVAQRQVIRAGRRHERPDDGESQSKSEAVAEADETSGAKNKPSEEHRTVVRTRQAIGKKTGSDRIAVGGVGHFRLLIAPSSGERACTILDALVAATEAQGWSVEDTDKGHVLLADGEAVGFVIEEKLDRIAHVITPRELKDKAEYDRKCALADRGIGYRPWPPSIPQYDYVPNGELVLKFDHDYDAGGTRRLFSDGKRQRLEDLIPAMIGSLEKWSAAVKAKREERARWKQDWEEQERRRQDRERRARVEGYRIAFLNRQVERKREIDGLAALIGAWEVAAATDAKFAELLEFARLYQAWLEEKIAPSSIAKRISALKLMDDDVYIYDPKRID